MVEEALLSAILDSLKEPILIADAEHVIRYMNRAAIEHYEGGASLIGRSLLDCHNERSQQKMKEILVALQAGADERLMSVDEKRRGFMCAVRDPQGRLLGYYERYEPVSG